MRWIAYLAIAATCFLTADQCVVCRELQEEKLQYSTDLFNYELSFDPAKTKPYDMQFISWLSPFNYDDYKTPYTVAGSRNNGIVEKLFLVPPLERRASTLPKFVQEPLAAPDEPSPILRNAQAVLAYGRQEITALREKPLPPILEPIRKYLLDSLSYTLKLQELRLYYIKSNDAGPLTKMLVINCACLDNDCKGLMKRLSNTPGQVARMKLTYSSWYNSLLSCYKAKTGPYPVEVWKHFLSLYGIHENSTAKHIE